MAKAVVRKAIRQHQIGCPKHRVVTRRLIEYLLPDPNIGRLTLGHQERLSLPIHHYNISPLRLTIERDRIFTHHRMRLNSAMAHQVADQMLPHPLLGGQYQPQAPHSIPNLRHVVLTSSTQFNPREIQFWQFYRFTHHAFRKKMYLCFRQRYKTMRTLLLSLLIFSCTAVAAQPHTKTENREKPRSWVMPYASADETTHSLEKHRYGAVINEWSQTEGTFSSHFTTPFAWTNRQIFIRIDSASAPYELRVNGRRVAVNYDPNTPADFLITKLAKEGRNTLQIKLQDSNPMLPIESWRTQESTPAIGGVYVFSSPTMGIRDVLVNSRFSTADGTVVTSEVAIVVKSYALNERKARIYYDLENPAGENVATGYGDLTLRMRGEDTLRFVVQVPDSTLWSRERPQHYTLRLRTQREGRNMEFPNLPLGLRVVSLQEGVLRINGRQEQLRIQQIATPATAEQLRALQHEGINTLQPLPGAVSSNFYRLCDTLGMYVIAQAPIDSHQAGEARSKGGNPSNDPAWRPYYLERVENSYHHAKRHPSVIGFSIAHDSSNGICLYDSYLHIKEQENQRPILYFGAGGEWNHDIINQ